MEEHGDSTIDSHKDDLWHIDKVAKGFDPICHHCDFNVRSFQHRRTRDDRTDRYFIGIPFGIVDH